MQDSDLATIISSRICHDLVSPVGAVVNGIDLIREIGPGDVKEELTMISQSASRASSLLQFYRIAFGAAAIRDAPITRPVLQCQAAQMIAGNRISLDWPETGGPPLTRPEARLLFQLVMCARAIVGMRGAIHIAIDSDASLPMAIAIHPHGNGHGGPAALNRDMIELMRSPGHPDALAPRLVEFALVQASAAALGVVLTVVETGDSVTLRAAGA